MRLAVASSDSELHAKRSASWNVTDPDFDAINHMDKTRSRSS